MRGDGGSVDIDGLVDDFDGVAFEADDSLDIVFVFGERFGLHAAGIRHREICGGFFARECEDDDIAAFRAREACDIFVDEGQSDAVAELRDEELIAFEERGNHGSRGDLEWLDEERSEDERDRERDEQAFDDFLEARFACESKAFFGDLLERCEGWFTGMRFVFERMLESRDGCRDFVLML